MKNSKAISYECINIYSLLPSTVASCQQEMADVTSGHIQSTFFLFLPIT